MNEDFERGVKEGELRATVGAHTEHLARVNGSIEHFASSADGLRDEMRKGFERIELETRLAEERAKATALALVKARDDKQQVFSKRMKVVATAIPLLTGLSGYLAHYVGLGL